MAFKITDDCTACGTCLDDCPAGAISEGDEIYSIDAAKCTECNGMDEQQCASGCPTGACVKA